MSLRPGDVIRVLDRQLRQAKPKRFICIDHERQQFLRINSNSYFQPHHLLKADECDFLDHDSYVELRQFVRPYAFEVQEAEYLGRLTQSVATRIMIAAEAAETLTEDQKQAIREAFGTI